MSVLLDIIRYYTAEKNSQDIGEITCLRLSQNFMYDTVNAPNIKNNFRCSHQFVKSLHLSNALLLHPFVIER